MLEGLLESLSQIKYICPKPNRVSVLTKTKYGSSKATKDKKADSPNTMTKGIDFCISINHYDICTLHL